MTGNLRRLTVFFLVTVMGHTIPSSCSFDFDSVISRAKQPFNPQTSNRCREGYYPCSLTFKICK